MTKPDVIIILGGGVDGTLTPILYTKERLEAFLKKKKIEETTPIVASGGYSIWMKTKPKFTESQVMKNFLSKKGFRNVFTEIKSRDTIGNVIYTKQIFKKHSAWRNVLIVTTKGHVLRSDWLFKKIFGNKFHFEYLEVASRTINFQSPQRKKYESYILSVYKRLFKGIDQGDDKAILRKLKTHHPAFSKSKEARALAEEINKTKIDYLGYDTPPSARKH